MSKQTPPKKISTPMVVSRFIQVDEQADKCDGCSAFHSKLVSYQALLDTREEMIQQLYTRIEELEEDYKAVRLACDSYMKQVAWQESLISRLEKENVRLWEGLKKIEEKLLEWKDIGGNMEMLLLSYRHKLLEILVVARSLVQKGIIKC